MQIGDFDTDHEIVTGHHIAAEYWNERNVSRPVFTLNPVNNGSDLAGEAVAAYAALSILFRSVDPPLSVSLEEDAFSMYAFMERMPDTRYSDNNVQFRIAYESQTPRGHEFLAAAWMFRMTNDPKYVATAQAVHAQAGPLFHNPVIGWSNPVQVRSCNAWRTCMMPMRVAPVAPSNLLCTRGRCVRVVQEARLVLEEVGEGAMLQSVQLWLNDHMSGKDARFTLKGLWHEAEWGTLRNAALIAHVALRTAQILDNRAFDSGEVVNVRCSPACIPRTRHAASFSVGLNPSCCAMLCGLCWQSIRRRMSGNASHPPLRCAMLRGLVRRCAVDGGRP